jgi:hypothetical protein
MNTVEKINRDENACENQLFMAVKQFRNFWSRSKASAKENVSSRLTEKQSPSAAGSFLRLTPKSNCVDGVANSSRAECTQKFTHARQERTLESQ